MACIEGPRWCSSEEYQRHKSKRLQPQQFVVEQYFTFMGAVEKQLSSDLRSDACLLPVQCSEWAEPTKTAGIWVVGIVIVDNDFIPRSGTVDILIDAAGMICDPDQLEINRVKGSLLEGYFRDYDDGLSDVMREFRRELSVPVSSTPYVS